MKVTIEMNHRFNGAIERPNGGIRKNGTHTHTDTHQANGTKCGSLKSIQVYLDQINIFNQFANGKNQKTQNENVKERSEQLETSINCNQPHNAFQPPP